MATGQGGAFVAEIRRAVLSGDTTATPKTGDGPVESIRALRVVRGGAVKARTAALNELTALITTAPAALRETLRDTRGTARLRACQALQPDLTRLADPAHGLMLALRTCAEVAACGARRDTPRRAATDPSTIRRYRKRCWRIFRFIAASRPSQARS